MGSGKPARDTSIRPQASVSEKRGGCSIAEAEKVGIHADCELPRLRQNLQGMAEANEVNDEEKVEGEEEITASDEEEAEQIQCLPIPDTPTLNDVLAHRAMHYPYRPWCPDWVEGRGREFGHFACQPERAEVYPRCRSTIAS